jgi:hypothetical protein
MFQQVALLLHRGTLRLTFAHSKHSLSSTHWSASVVVNVSDVFKPELKKRPQVKDGFLRVFKKHVCNCKIYVGEDQMAW